MRSDCGFKLSALLLITGVLLTGCQEKTYGPEANRAPIETQTEIPAPEDKAESAANLDKSVDSYETILATNPDAHTLRQDVLAPLSQYIFGQGRLSDPKAFYASEFFDYLRTYHQALQDLAARDDGQPETVALFEQYETHILKPCARDINSCAALKIVAKDQRYTSVILAALDILKLKPNQAWVYTFFALDFRKGKLNHNEQRQILAQFESYLKSIANDNSQESLTAVKQAGQRLNQLIAMIGDWQSPELKDFLERVDIWSTGEPSNTPSTSNISQEVRAALRTEIWSGLVAYGAFTKGEPNPSFKRWMNGGLESFAANIRFFEQSEARKRVWKSFDLVDPRNTDRLLTFLFDQVFQGTLRREDAIQLIHQTKLPQMETLLTVMQEYTRLRFAMTMIETQGTLKEALGDSSHYKTTRELSESLQKANPVEMQWSGVVSRLNAIRNVSENTASQILPILPKEVTDRIDSIFGNLSHEIKRLVTYPNMLPVMYYISQANLSESIQILWFTFDIDSDLIFDELFSGNLSFWFNFTSSIPKETKPTSPDEDKFTSPEVLLAFRNALASELFSDYDIKPSNFILEAINRLTTKLQVSLDKGVASLYQDIYIGKTYKQNTSDDNNVSGKAYDFCAGRTNEEVLPLKDLPTTLVGHQEVLTNASTTAAVYDMSLEYGEDHGRMPMVTFADQIRTKELYHLQMIEKMRDIYKEYLKQYPEVDEPAQMKLIDQKIAEIHNQISRLFGLIYFASNRYGDCVFKILELAKQRQVSAMKYESFYLHQVFTDLKTVMADPSQLDALNAKYTAPRLNSPMPVHDRIKKLGDRYIFQYSKGDFIMRVKDYLTKGATDPQTGKTYPSIAPAMTVIEPINALKESKYMYGFFYKNVDQIPLQINPQDSEDVLLKQAYSVFYNQTSMADYMPTLGVEPFATWYGQGPRSVSTAIVAAFGVGRLTFFMTLMKFGGIEVYDFEKPGCDPQLTNEDLNKNCRKSMTTTAESVLQQQKRLLNLLNIDGDLYELFKKTNTPSVFGNMKAWTNVFYSLVDGNPMGLLDGYLFLASNQSLTNPAVWPGSPATSTPGGADKRLGPLDRASTYFTAFGTAGEGSLLNVAPNLNGHIKVMYDEMVSKEFALQYEIEAAAAKEAATQPPIVARTETFNNPYTFVPLTNYVAPTSVRQDAFDRSTDNIFKEKH